MRSDDAMSATQRRPAGNDFDAIVDLAPLRGLTTHATALVKLCYEIGPDGCRLAPARPLEHDLRDPRLRPRIPAGSDYWPWKDCTDVVVRGSAFAPGGRPTERMEVSARIGAAEKRVAVFGRRELGWTSDGRARIGSPEPFTEVPLTYAHAYGGIDPRVAPPEPQSLGAALRLAVDRPGLYPRNPFGKGYLVEPGPIAGLELPNLEDPGDLLTPDRIAAGDPARWYEQPLPWCFDWVSIAMFPRQLFLGTDAWFPAPDDERLPEVRRGYLPRCFRAERVMDAGGAHPRLAQGGSYGMVLPRLRGGAPMAITGMHPDEPTVRFDLPQPPELTFEIEGAEVHAAPRLHHVVVTPADRQVAVVYGARAPLARPFIPGVHRTIPVSVSVDRRAPVLYPTPVPLKERLRRAAEDRSP